MSPDELRAHLNALYPGKRISEQVSFVADDLDVAPRRVWDWLAGNVKRPVVPAQKALQMLRKARRC